MYYRMTTGEIVLWIYLIGCIVTFFPLTAWFYTHLISPDMGANVGAMLVAAVCSLTAVWFWPIALVAFPMFWIVG